MCSACVPSAWTHTPGIYHSWLRLLAPPTGGIGITISGGLFARRAFPEPVGDSGGDFGVVLLSEVEERFSNNPRLSRIGAGAGLFCRVVIKPVDELGVHTKASDGDRLSVAFSSTHSLTSDPPLYSLFIK